MKTTLKLLTTAMLLATTACQQQYASQTPALKAAEKYVAALSGSIAGKKSTSSKGMLASDSSASRGLASNTYGSTSTSTTSGSFGSSYSPFDPFSYFQSAYKAPAANTWSQWGSQWGQANQTGVYGGTYLMRPSMIDETAVCGQMVNAVAQKMENLDFMLGNLERCLFRLAINKSAPMNYLWRNDSPQLLNYAGYLNDYTRPAGYGQYSYDPYNQFLLNGQTSAIPRSNYYGTGYGY